MDHPRTNGYRSNNIKNVTNSVMFGDLSRNKWAPNVLSKSRTKYATSTPHTSEQLRTT